jgi:starvation-inducible outer membrane lipoprotein
MSNEKLLEVEKLLRSELKQAQDIGQTELRFVQMDNSVVEEWNVREWFPPPIYSVWSPWKGCIVVRWKVDEDPA